MFAHRTRACKAAPAKTTPLLKRNQFINISSLNWRQHCGRDAVRDGSVQRDAANLEAQDLCWEARGG
eukprot:14332604-Alexandrium_andersonii.AAC.1